MTEDKQCLQRVERDTTEGRCFEERCGKNMLDDLVVPTSYDEWSAMVKTGDECQLTAYMSLHGNICCDGQSYGRVVPTSFSLCRSTCLTSMRHTTRWLWYGLGDEARCVPRSTTPDTAQSERVLVKLIDTSS